MSNPIRTSIKRIYSKVFSSKVHELFLRDFIRDTDLYRHVTWLGHPIWQNILDAWTLQETLAEIRPSLFIECGTNQGGCALYVANLFDLMGQGRVLTIDVETMHELRHPRIEFLLGSSTAPDIVEEVRARVSQTTGHVLVMLDSDHSASHVLEELQLYHDFVTVGSFIYVQDGVKDTLYRGGGPGPLTALREFMLGRADFVIDHERCNRLLITHSPEGWLKRIR